MDKENIEKVIRYIDDNIYNNITLEDISSYVGYSKFYLSKIFTQYMDTSIMKYVKKRKLLASIEDIVNGYKIIDIALKMGYASHSSYTKAFIKEFGVSPILVKICLMNDIERSNAMEKKFIQNRMEGKSKSELVKYLFEILDENQIEYDKNLIEESYKCADEAYDGIMRYSGEEYIVHMLKISILLATLEASQDVIVAGMFCDVLQKTELSKEVVTTKIPKNISGLIIKVNQFSVLDTSLDDQAIIIKLVERLQNMRTIEYINPEKRAEKSVETMNIFIPLAQKLSIKKIEDELKILSLKYI